jgi:cell division transport system permease protein
VVSLALLASFNVQQISKDVKENVTMFVFLKLGSNDEDIKEFEDKIKSMENISQDWIVLTPKERKEMLLEDPDIGKTIGELVDDENEIFHQSYEIKVKNIKKIDNTVKELENMEIVHSVNYGETTISQLVSTFDLIEKIAYGIVIILVIVTVFLIVNTIKLTIFSRRREISIMRVVGASNMTIKHPFIIEGFVIGLLGSIVPVLITIFGYRAFYNRLDDGHFMTFWLEFIDPHPFIYVVSIIIVAIGIVVGMFGSGRAVRKYLKV